MKRVNWKDDMNELKLLEVFLDSIQNINKRVAKNPSLGNYLDQEYPVLFKENIKVLILEIHDLFEKLPTQKDNMENPPLVLFQHRHKMLERTDAFYTSTMVYLKLFLETNNFETRNAWYSSKREYFNSYQYLTNQINKEIRRWKKRL